MAEWSAECSSDSDSENLFVAIGEQFKSKNLVQFLSSIRGGEEDQPECMKNVKRKKFNKKVKAVSEPSKQEHEIGASDTTPTDMRSPLSTGSRELQHTYQQQRFASCYVPPRIYVCL